MGRAAVRAAAANYLAGAGIEFLGTVRQHPPKVTPEGDFMKGEDPGVVSGAVIFLHFPDQIEHRIAGGPPGPNPTPAKKFRTYTLGLICCFRSKKADTQDVGADNDAFLDSLVLAIESNRQAGTGATTATPPGDGSGAIFTWGEGGEVTGSPDVHVRAGMPRLIRQGVSQVWTTAEVIVTEIVDT